MTQTAARVLHHLYSRDGIDAKSPSNSHLRNRQRYQSQEWDVVGGARFLEVGRLIVHSEQIQASRG